MERHLEAGARLLGLDPARTTGLTTAANLDNAALHRVEGEDYSLHLLVSAGVEGNALRAGDPAALDERAGAVEQLELGTVNLLLLADADLSAGCMVRALVTCTEAKAAAFQELLVSSRGSRGIATGSGTDGAVLVARPDAPAKLTEAGGHFRLGERLGNAVNRAVKEALHRQSGLCAQGQHRVLRRLERFGIGEEALYRDCCAAAGRTVDRERFRREAEEMSADGYAVGAASLLAHLLDQLDWGLIHPAEAARLGEELLELLAAHQGAPRIASLPRCLDAAATADALVTAIRRTVEDWFLGSSLFAGE